MHRIKTYTLVAVILILTGTAHLSAAVQYQIHTVKRGENLYNISKQHNVTVDALRELNNLTTDRLNVGQKLKIKPLKETVQPRTETVATRQIHTVRRGENLSGISKRYNTTVAALKQLNNLTTDRLYVGQKLKVKPLKETVQPRTETVVSGQIHTVRRGENLSGISKRYNTTVAALKQLNNLTTDRLYVGQKLKTGQPPLAPPPRQPPEQPAPPLATADTSATATGSEPDSVLMEKVYSVQREDTLFKIARENDMTVEQLKKLNNLTTDRLYVGQKLKIKTKTAIALPPQRREPAITPPPAPADTSTAAAGSEPDSVLIEKVYIVQRKDTLFKIARENNMTVEQLKRLNNLTSNTLRVGQRLYVTARKANGKETSPPPRITKQELRAKTRLRSDLIMPVEGKVISEFGIRGGRPHKGIDIGAAIGSPILAVLDGTVVYSGLQGSYGNVVVVEHPDFVMTVYAHNEKNLVSVGETVKKGQQIGTVGSTGNATTPHLHFEYRIKGKAVNPRRVLPFG